MPQPLWFFTGNSLITPAVINTFLKSRLKKFSSVPLYVEGNKHLTWCLHCWLIQAALPDAWVITCAFMLDPTEVEEWSFFREILCVCVCVCMCVRSSAIKWHQNHLITGKGTLAGTGCTNNRMMDPFTFRLPVQIQGRFVVNKSHYTLRAIQWPVWNELKVLIRV